MGRGGAPNLKSTPGITCTGNQPKEKTRELALQKLTINNNGKKEKRGGAGFEKGKKGNKAAFFLYRTHSEPEAGGGELFNRRGRLGRGGGGRTTRHAKGVGGKRRKKTPKTVCNQT